MRSIPLAALVAVAAALFAPTAAQAAPCWQQVIDDWRDGRIDGDFSVRCYRDALAQLPEDLRIYGTAESDIELAMTRALAKTTARLGVPAVVRTPNPVVVTTTAPLAGAISEPRRAKRIVREPSRRRDRLVTAAPSEDAATGAVPPQAVIAGMAVVGAAVVVLLLRGRAGHQSRR